MQRRLAVEHDEIIVLEHAFNDVAVLELVGDGLHIHKHEIKPSSVVLFLNVQCSAQFVGTDSHDFAHPFVIEAGNSFRNCEPHRH